jgi:hypothetical protein
VLMSASTSAEPVRSRRRTGRFLIASASLSQPPRVPTLSGGTFLPIGPKVNVKLGHKKAQKSAKYFCPFCAFCGWLFVFFYRREILQFERAWKVGFRIG